MVLQEVDLMLHINAWSVDVAAHHAEMIINVAGVDSSGGLGDQLRATHRLPVPIRGLRTS